jgi:hypothetical protein
MKYLRNKFTEKELQEALKPIASLISKSGKSQQKLTHGTWQYKMQGDNIKALRYAEALIIGDTTNKEQLTQQDLLEVLRSIASMINKAEKYQEKFLPGTTQHTLQRNRLNALRISDTLIKEELGSGGKR